MLNDISSNSFSFALLYLHLGLQICGGYWITVLDGSSCQDTNIQYLTYFSYALIGFNLIFVLFDEKINQRFLRYLPTVVNIAFAATIIYFGSIGYNSSSPCASTRALFQIIFIETVIAIILSFLLLLAKKEWSDRYTNWPGNLTWGIMFLKYSFGGKFHTAALAIGIIYVLISLTSFLINVYLYNTIIIQGRDHKMLVGQWNISMVLIGVSEVVAIALLVTASSDGQFWWQYSRKIFAIFSVINLIDFFFWLNRFRKQSLWISNFFS